MEDGSAGGPVVAERRAAGAPAGRAVTGADGLLVSRFEKIYASAFPAVLGYALRRAASADDAADVVAETFLVAWRRLNDVPEGDAARLWLYGVARRVLANQRRAHRRQHRLTGKLVADLLVAGIQLASAPLQGAAAHEQGFAGFSSAEGGVAAALARLSSLDREMLRLVAWEGLSPSEVGRCSVAPPQPHGCGCTAPGGASPSS